MHLAASATPAHNASLAGFPGLGQNGGAGGSDPNLDSGGGGGGGYYGGGGGAATDGEQSGGPGHASGQVAGGGGGGGASYVNPSGPASLGSVSGISSAPGVRADRSQNGANGSVTLTWIDCSLLTDDGSTSASKGTVQRWTPSPIDEETGGPLAATLQLLDGGGNPVGTLAVTGGVYTIDGDTLVFTPDPDFVGVAPAAAYRVTDGDGRTADGVYTPTVTAAALAATDAAAAAAALGALALLAAGVGVLVLRRRRAA